MMTSDFEGHVGRIKRLQNRRRSSYRSLSDNVESERDSRTFDTIAKPFNGFPDIDTKSKKYYTRFERFRKALFNPVVVLQRINNVVFSEKPSDENGYGFSTVEVNEHLSKFLPLSESIVMEYNASLSKTHCKSDIVPTHTGSGHQMDSNYTSYSSSVSYSAAGVETENCQASDSSEGNLSTQVIIDSERHEPSENCEIAGNSPRIAQKLRCELTTKDSDWAVRGSSEECQTIIKEAEGFRECTPSQSSHSNISTGSYDCTTSRFHDLEGGEAHVGAPSEHNRLQGFSTTDFVQSFTKHEKGSKNQAVSPSKCPSRRPQLVTSVVTGKSLLSKLKINQGASATYPLDSVLGPPIEHADDCTPKPKDRSFDLIPKNSPFQVIANNVVPVVMNNSMQKEYVVNNCSSLQVFQGKKTLHNANRMQTVPKEKVDSLSHGKQQTGRKLDNGSPSINVVRSHHKSCLKKVNGPMLKVENSDEHKCSLLGCKTMVQNGLERLVVKAETCDETVAEGIANGDRPSCSTRNGDEKRYGSCVRNDGNHSGLCQWNRRWTALISNAKVELTSAKQLNRTGIKDCLHTRCPWEILCKMIKPCVVKLHRIPDLDRVAKRAVMPDDRIHYPVVTKGGCRKVRGGVRTILPIKNRKNKIERVENRTGLHIQPGLKRLDLSDGFTVKKLCELSSIKLDESDDGDEDTDVYNPCLFESGPGTPQVNSRSRQISSNLPIKSDARKSQLSPGLGKGLSPQVGCNPNVDLMHTIGSSVDSVVSENPVPSGVEALNELGFLDNESFQYGKDHSSGNIWSDVLDFSEAEDSEMEDSWSQDMPKAAKDLIPCLDSETPVEVSSISGKVTISRGLDKSDLETIDIKTTLPNDNPDILLDVEKEYLTSDPLTSDDGKEDFKADSSLLKKAGASEFLSTLIRTTPQNKTSESEFLSTLIRPKRHSPQHRVRPRRKRRMDDSDLAEETDDLSPNDHKTTKHVAKRSKPQMASRNVPPRILRESDFQSNTAWMSQRINEHRGDEDLKTVLDTKPEIPTSESLYRDLSTIPYVMKCNFQNRCRKCKNLHPCAKANRNFQLYWTVTVGVGRRPSRGLLETFNDPEDPCVISRTSAYIAASAVCPQNTTVLVPAEIDVVQKLLPFFHSKLLLQLRMETIELERTEKKTHSDMAIAETLQLKRAMIALKTRPRENNKDPPQSQQTIRRSLINNPHGRPSSNQFLPKSKFNNKFRFVKKSPVSILPEDQLVPKREEAVSANTSPTEIVNEIKRRLEFPEIPTISFSNAKGGPVNRKIISISRPNSPRSTSIHQQNLVRSLPLKRSWELLLGDKDLPEPRSKKKFLDLLGDESSKSWGSDCAPNLSLGNSDHSQSSSFSCSFDIREAREITGKVESPKITVSSTQRQLYQGSTESKTTLLPNRDFGSDAQDVPSNVWPEMKVPTEASTSDEEDELPYQSDVPGESKANPEDSSDVILIPERVESIDLTETEEDAIDLIDKSIPPYAAICPSRPDLGYVRVIKTFDKLILNDKAIVRAPVHFTKVGDLNTFLNSRLDSAHRTNPVQWVFVLATVIAAKDLKPTNPRFWLDPIDLRETLRGRNGVTISQQIRSQISSKVSTSSSTSSLNVNPAKDPMGRKASSYEVVTRCFKPIDRGGKILRINGHPVVVGRPVNALTDKSLANGTGSRSSLPGRPSPVIQVKLPVQTASTNKSAVPRGSPSSKISVAMSGSSPQYIILPGHLAPSGQPTKYLLKPTQAIQANTDPSGSVVHAPSISSSGKGPITLHRVVKMAEKGVSLSNRKVARELDLSSSFNVSTAKELTPGLQQNSAVAVVSSTNKPSVGVPLVSASTLRLSPSRTGYRTQPPARLKQIVVTPGSVTFDPVPGPSNRLIATSRPAQPGILRQNHLLTSCPRPNPILKSKPAAKHQPILILRKGSPLQPS